MYPISSRAMGREEIVTSAPEHTAGPAHKTREFSEDWEFGVAWISSVGLIIGLGVMGRVGPGVGRLVGAGLEVTRVETGEEPGVGFSVESGPVAGAKGVGCAVGIATVGGFVG